MSLRKTLFACQTCTDLPSSLLLFQKIEAYLLVVKRIVRKLFNYDNEIIIVADSSKFSESTVCLVILFG